MRRSLELFLSLGATAGLLTGVVTPAHQALAQHLPHANHSQQEGGEGGEGGESGQTAAITSDVDVLVVLAQMQGHLLVAQELLSQGQVKAAEPHVGHPVDELYGALQPALQQRRIAPFLSSLEDLRQQVQLNPKASATTLKLAQAQRAVEGAANSVAESMRMNPKTVAAVVRQLADSAVEEYGAAVAEGRVVEVIEYQDARGFLREAQRLLDQAITSPKTSNPQLRAMQPTISAMLKAFPTVMPPQNVVLTVDQLKQLQGRL